MNRGCAPALVLTLRRRRHRDKPLLLRALLSAAFGVPDYSERRKADTDSLLRVLSTCGVSTSVDAFNRGFDRLVLGTRRKLAFDNLALRQQIIVLQRSVKRPRLREERLGPEGPRATR